MLTIYPCFEKKHQQSYRKGENTVIIGGSLIITAHLNYWVKQKETVNFKDQALAQGGRDWEHIPHWEGTSIYLYPIST